MNHVQLISTVQHQFKSASVCLLGLPRDCPLFPSRWSPVALWLRVSRAALPRIERCAHGRPCSLRLCWITPHVFVHLYFYDFFFPPLLLAVKKLCFLLWCVNSTDRLFPGERVNGSTPPRGLQTSIFDRPSDWDREIKRTGASEWRVCSVNENYVISPRSSSHSVLWLP